MQTQRNHKQS